MMLLARREHARAELRRKLMRASYTWLRPPDRARTTSEDARNNPLDNPIDEAFDEISDESLDESLDDSINGSLDGSVNESVDNRGDWLKAAIDRVLDDLEGNELLSEARFCEMYVRSSASKGMGPLKIAAALQQRGVDPDQVRRELASAEIDWAEGARTARQRKFGAAIPQSREAFAKQWRFLLQRGFEREQIQSALGDRDAS